MLARQFQLVVFVGILLSVPTLQQEEPFPLENPGWDGKSSLQIEETEGNFTMTTDRKLPLLKTLAEYLSTKPEDIQAIQEHPTVGNYELKVLDMHTSEIQITIETLVGKITDILEPGEKRQLAWLDGRKFNISKMSWFDNGMAIERRSLITLKNMGKDGIGLSMR